MNSAVVRLLRAKLWCVIGLLCACLMVAYWAALELFPPRSVFSLSGDLLVAESGCSFIARLPKPGLNLLVKFTGDSESDPQASSAKLYESGKQLGPAHTPHAEIRRDGGGAFSHWGNILFFSASDCSNPKSNGRVYWIELSSQPKAFTRITGCLATVSALILVWFWIRFPIRSRVKTRAAILIAASMAPTDKLAAPLFLSLLAVVLFLAAVTSLFNLWTTGRSVSLSLGGLYQISDASVYWTCSNGLLHFGNFSTSLNFAEICERRPIYPSWLAGIIAMGGLTIRGTLILQALFVSVALALLIRQGIRLTGSLGGIFIATLFLPYFYSNAWPLVMTENAGLVFGLTGVACLLRAAEMRSSRWVFIGCALVSIALNARAGAFFVLPMLILWSILTAKLSNISKLAGGSNAFIGCAVGFLLQIIIVYGTGGNPTYSNSNFSFTLYGLSLGGLGWQQTLVDHPELDHMADVTRAKLVYQLAFANIIFAPWMLIEGLAKSLRIYLQLVAFGTDIPLRLSQFATLLWYLGWIPIWHLRQQSQYLLLGLCGLGILLSAPFLALDGGPRVFAATIAVEAIQMSIGLVWLVTLIFRSLFRNQPTTCQLQPQGAWPEVLFLAMLGFCFCSSVPYRTFFFREPAGHRPLCEEGQYSVVTRIGYESLLLDFTTATANPDFMKGQVDRDAFVRGISPYAWYANDIYKLRAKSILLLNQTDPAAPLVPYNLLSSEHLGRHIGKTVRICVSSIPNQELFGTIVQHVESVTEVPLR